MSWNDFHSNLVESALRELWAHWGALGVGGTHHVVRRRVDLEALLVGTWSFGRTDPRLFDEGLSWCCRFGDIVNVKRLEKLLSQVSDDTMTRVALSWSETLTRHGSVRWDLKGAPDQNGIETLFLTRELRPLTVGRDRDDAFQLRGLTRGRFTLSERARQPDLAHPNLTQLFCRKFVGGGCRAEVLSLLVHSVDATTAELAHMTVYSSRLVQDVLRDFNEAGLLDWNPGPGRTTRPRLRESAARNLRATMAPHDASLNWAGLYEARDWSGFFVGLQPLWRAARRITDADLTGFKAQAVLHEALEKAFATHSRTNSPAVYVPRLAADSFEALLSEAWAYLASILPSFPAGASGA